MNLRIKIILKGNISAGSLTLAPRQLQYIPYVVWNENQPSNSDTEEL